MILSKLTLQSFRNYKKQVFQLSSDITVIVGPNAVGKTNVMEAIYLLASGKSFHAETDREMLMRGSLLGRVKADIGDIKLEVVVTGGEVAGQKTPIKKLFVNGVSRQMVNFVGNFRAVIFWPEDLELVTDSPSIRRRYLDRVLVQTDREYRRNLFSYERGLRQRNRLLDLINEGTASRNQLIFWNQLLISAGGYITDKRAEYINYVNGSSLKADSKWSERNNYKLEYDKSVISEARLEQYKEEEVAAKATLVGPHRDDFIFLKIAESPSTSLRINSEQRAESEYISLSAYGSRGEQRLGVLWLKLAELNYMTEKTEDRPMLLLDDIFSELDESHRELVLDLIKNQQTAITSAEDDILKMLKRYKLNCKVIELPIK
jgi:DNA replication and repair protein RecF